MIDIHFVVYLGVITVFLVGVLAVGIATVLVFTAIAVITGIRGRSKHPATATVSAPIVATEISADVGKGEEEWFWRQDSRPRRLPHRAGLPSLRRQTPIDPG